MTGRFAVGSVSTLAMGALLLGSASFWLNRPGSTSHAAPWGDISSLSAGAQGRADDKAQLLKLAALKSGDATATPAGGSAPVTAAVPVTAPVALTPAPAAVTTADAAPAGVPPLAAAITPAAPTPTAPLAQTAAIEAPAAAASDSDGAPSPKSGLLDLNTASAEALDHVGAGHIGRTIVAHRPYRSVKDLVSRRVLRTSDYQKVESRVRVD